MEFSLLNLKDFGTLFPNKNITDVAYKKVVNQYIDDKLGSVKNINKLSGNELIEKKKEYLNTYIIPLMYLLFSKYYIQYNNLNILVNKNNSILHEFNNLKLFYAYNNPIINSVNVYFYKKYSGLNKNNGNNGNKKNNNSIDISTLTLMQNNKTEIVTNLTEYIDNLNFENIKITYKNNLNIAINDLIKEMNLAITNLNKSYDKFIKHSEIINPNIIKPLTPEKNNTATIKPLTPEKNNTATKKPSKEPKINYIKQIDDINNFIKEILNKVIYYHKITPNESTLISDINNILKYACSILIKTKIASSITITIDIPDIASTIISLTEIKEIYEKQIKLYKNYISSNKSNNNIKKISQENLTSITNEYYDSIKNIHIIKKPPNIKEQSNPTTQPNPAQQTSTKNNTKNNLFINQVCTFIYYDNVLTNKFIINNKTDNTNNISKIDEILPRLKKYKEILKLNLNSKNTKNTIINNDTLKKFLKNEKELFQIFLTEIGASSASDTNKKAYDDLKIQNNIFDKINERLDEINQARNEIIKDTFFFQKINEKYYNKEIKEFINSLNNTIIKVNDIKKNYITNKSTNIPELDIKKIYVQDAKPSIDYTKKDDDEITKSFKSIDSSINSIKEAINTKKSADQSKFIKYANYWINTYSKIIIKAFPDNYENSSYTEIIPVFDKPVKINIKKCVNNLYDSFITIDKKLINDINESTKKIQKNRLMFYLTQQDTQFKDIQEAANINSLNKLIPAYITSFKNKNKNTKQDLFINQIKKDNKSIANNPDVQQFLNTIYTYNDTLIANLASKINNKLITKGNQLNTQISNFKNDIKNLFKKIDDNSKKNNTPSTINNKTITLNNKNKNLIYIQAYTDVIQLYFMNLIYIKLLYTNS